MIEIDVCAICGKPLRGRHDYWANVNGQRDFDLAVGADCYRQLKKAGRDGIKQANRTLYHPDFAPYRDEGEDA